MDKSLDSLSADLKPLVYELLARLVERQALVMIVQTGRTLEEHQANLAAGTSWTRHSKHLSRKLRRPAAGSGEDDHVDAIDLCPWEVWTAAPGGDKISWDSKHPTWAVIGELAEALGLRWGGRWAQRDLGHVEWLFPGEQYRDIPISSAAYREHGVPPTKGTV